MPRARTLILAALLWGSLLNIVFAQAPAMSQPSTAQRDDLFIQQQNQRLVQQQLQLRMLQMAAARAAMPLMRPLPPIPPKPPYDRAIDTVEWMTAASCPVVVAHLNVAFIESPKFNWATVHVDEILKGPLPPADFRLRCDGVPREQIRAWIDNRTPVLLFLTHFTKDEFSLTPSLGLDWRSAAIPLDKPVIIVTLAPARLTVSPVQL